MPRFYDDACIDDDADEFNAPWALMFERLQTLERKRTERHFHKCPSASCGTVWSHARSDFNSQDSYTAGHHCPDCGAEEYLKCTKDGKPL